MDSFIEKTGHTLHSQIVHEITPTPRNFHPTSTCTCNTGHNTDRGPQYALSLQQHQKRWSQKLTPRRYCVLSHSNSPSSGHFFPCRPSARRTGYPPPAPFFVQSVKIGRRERQGKAVFIPPLPPAFIMEIRQPGSAASAAASGALISGTWAHYFVLSLVNVKARCKV